VRLIQGAIDVWQAAHWGQPWSTFATFSLAMATPVVNYPELDPDLESILHEEIDRLPEVERLPVVLCDLEGLTYEQAGCLHWTVPALGCRLAKARKRAGGSYPARPDVQGVLPADEPGNSGASPI
jgi:DNA-directed RNA polymerase specialized sigma24 family protein